MLFALVQTVLVGIVMDILKEHAIAYSTPIITRLIKQSLSEGASPYEVPGIVLTTLGYGQFAREANELAGEEVLEIGCPANPDEGVAVPNVDGEYSCPHCEEDIVVKDGEATHKPLLCYSCPETGESEYVPAESGSLYACTGCRLEVMVVQEGDYLKVFHQLRVE